MGDRKEVVGEIKEAWAEGKAGLGGAVVINLIRERKGPGAYIVINPHNGRIIFISQFSSLYTLTSSVSVSTAVFLCSVVVCRPHLSLWWRFSHPKEAHCHAIHCVSLHNTPTHITAPLCIAFTFYKLQKRLSRMNACLSAQGSLYAGVLERVGGWAQPHLQTNYNKPFDLPVFWRNQFPSL